MLYPTFAVKTVWKNALAFSDVYMMASVPRSAERDSISLTDQLATSMGVHDDEVWHFHRPSPQYGRLERIMQHIIPETAAEGLATPPRRQGIVHQETCE